MKSLYFVSLIKNKYLIAWAKKINLINPVALKILKLICGVDWKVKGLDNIIDQPCILVSNHQGVWESFFIQTLIYPSYNILKKELLYIPIFGWALACLRPISIKRSNKFHNIVAI